MHHQMRRYSLEDLEDNSRQRCLRMESFVVVEKFDVENSDGEQVVCWLLLWL